MQYIWSKKIVPVRNIVSNGLLRLVFVSLLLSNPAFAQYRFDSWTTGDGLPHRNILSIIQAGNGYLWMTTSDGLVRFDGVRFTVYNTANTKGIKSNRLSELTEGSDGCLWIATGDAMGLIRYYQGAFTTYSTADGLPDNLVYGIHAEAEGDLILTPAGAVRWRDGRFVADDITGLAAPFIAPPHFDNTGAVWVQENNGLHRYTAAGETRYDNLQAMVKGLDIGSQFQDQSGTIWFRVGLQSSLWLKNNQTKLGSITDGQISFYTPPDKLLWNGLSPIYKDHKGNLWFGTDKGLGRYANGKFQFFSEKDGVSSDAFYSIIEDREGALWVTTNNGLIRIREQAISTFSKAEGMIDENVYPLYQDSEDVIWIGAWKEGLSQYQNGKFSRVDKPGDLTSFLVTSLFKSRDGSLWIGAYAGVTQYKDGVFKRYKAANGLSYGTVYAITQDHNGDLWFGADQGLSRFRDGKFTNYTTKDGLPSNDIRFLYEDKDGRLWIATYGGLAVFKDGSFTAYTEKDGLSGEHLRCIYEDAEGTFWIGTYDGGLTRFKDGKFIAYTIKNGLYDQGAFQILEDNRGNLWMSCNRGIYRVSRYELNEFAEGKRSSITCIAYGKKDGMLDAECNGGTQPAGFKAQDGKLWFSTQKGIVVIDPEAIPQNIEPPPVAIEECLIDRSPVAYQDLLDVSPDKESIEIHYTGLSFIKPEQIRFKYQMVGLDKYWIEAGTQRSVYYRHLPPGEYIFRVIAGTADGGWNMAGARLRIVVYPPFWRSWWFLIFGALMWAGILTLAYKLRISHLQKAHAAQENFSRKLLASQEKERQRIAAELHDSLGQELLIIKNWAMLGLNLSPANDNGEYARKQLQEISTTASQVIEEVREIAYNLRPYQLDELGLSKAIEAMLTRVSESSAIHFAFAIAPLDGVFSKEFEINFYRIVQEGINNIIKHSQATEASVIIECSALELRLMIRDNGKGFPADALDSGSRKRGFGLTGIAERARMLHGNFVIDSTIGEGTTLKLAVDLQENK